MKAKTERINEAPSCASVAPLLTALFDGEADDHSAQSARAHLLSCERCARTWLDWNQHRAILRNDNVPAPPPTLLWRVLLACRLSNLSSGKKAAPVAEAQPRCGSLFPDSALPTDLSARILAQTTRRAQPELANYYSISQNKGSRWRMASWPTLAVPALAAWIILLGQNAWFVPIEAPTINDSGVVLSLPPEGAEQVPTSGLGVYIPKISLTHTASGATRRAASHVVTVAKTSRVTASTATLPVVNRSVITHAAVNRAISQHSEVRVARPVLARVEVAPQEKREVRVNRAADEAPRVVAPVQVTWSARPPHSPPVEAVSTPATHPLAPRISEVTFSHTSAHLAARPRFRVATLSDEIKTPRPRVARPVLTSFTHDDRTILRSSRPVSAPTASPTRLAALETLDTADEHVQEMQSAVDDFRSSFSDDESTDTSDTNTG